MQKYKGEALMLITAIMWGSGFVGMAMALEHWTVFQLMALRFSLAAILMAILFYKKIKMINKAVLWKGFVLGAILFGAFMLQVTGLQFTTPSKNAFLTSINVIIVPIIAYLFSKRKIDRFELVAAILAVIGIGFLSLQGSFTINIGDFLTILCAVGFAFDIYYTNIFVKSEDPLALTLVQFITTAILSIIAVFIAGEVPTTYTTEGVYLILYLAIFCTGVANVCQNLGMQYANPTKSAIILSTESLFGTIFSVIILHELLTGRMIIGCILIFVAIIYSETKFTFKKKKTATL